MNRHLKPNPIPPEMRKKFERLLGMSGIELIKECRRVAERMGLETPELRKRLNEAGLDLDCVVPTADQAYRFLIPELFEYAAKVAKERKIDHTGKNVLETIAQQK